MGSCRSIAQVKPKTPTQVLSNEKTPLRNSYSVTLNEVNFLTALYRELCIRNNSKRLLEKSIFLLLVPIPVSSNQGMLGERMFDYYDKDKDGYINEETFLHIIEKFSKTDANEIYQELFYLCDLKNDNVVDRQEFTQVIQGVLLDALNNAAPCISDVNKPSGSTPGFGGFVASGSTIGSFSENIFKHKPSAETIVNEIFEKYSSSGTFLTFGEFKQLLTSQFWIIGRIKESFKVEIWRSEGEMKLKGAKMVQAIMAPRTVQTSAKVYIKGKWLKRVLSLKEVFLLVLNEKKVLEQVFFIEGCHFRTNETFLYLIYSTQYDERITFQFESEEECLHFRALLKQANPQRKFKNFYKQEEKIGHGKFSEVFKVSEIPSGQHWAVKVINKASMNQPEREMIRKEVSILQNFSHPGIIKIKEVFDTRKNVKIVMEYVENGDLMKKIKSEAVEEAKVKKVIKKVLELVKHLHAFGVVHRDIKPENLLIREENEEVFVKFIDFGLASYTLPGEIKHFKCGTLGYTAPEVFGGKYNSKADVWSVGVITFAYLMGKLPFFSYSRGEIVEMTQMQELVFEMEHWGQFSQQALDFTQKLLNKDPELRPSCEEALAHPWFLE